MSAGEYSCHLLRNTISKKHLIQIINPLSLSYTIKCTCWMSSLSDHLRSGRFVAPVGCGGPRIEEKVFVGGLEEPELWTRELGLQEGSQDLSNNELALVSSEHFSPSSPSALSNGLHLQGRLGPGTCRKRQTEPPVDPVTFTQTLRNMQTHMDLDVHTQAVSHAQMDVNSLVAPEHSRTPEAMHTSHQALPLAVPPLGIPPGPTNQLAAPAINTKTDIHSTFCPNPNTESSPLPVEAEKKYALRSSGRPRFPCHLRKSSRLRRCTNNGEKRTGPERGSEVNVATEEKIWTVKQEETAVVEKKEQITVEAIALTTPCPTAIPVTITVPKPVPKPLSKPGPRPGHRPGPKSRSRPMPKSVHKAAPKSILRQRQAAQALAMARAATHVPFSNPCPPSGPRITTLNSDCSAEGVALNTRRRGRFAGVSISLITA